jgi:hypothetical protein
MNLRISKRLALAMAAAALAGLGGGIAVVGAHDVTFQQTVGFVTDTATSPGDRYKVRGDVGSVPKCEPDRTVKFFRELTGDDRLKGKDETDGKGEFKFVFPNGLKIGMYYLKVVKKVLRANDDHRHVCEKSKTSSFTAGNNP